jgi:hypothetical protein
VPLGEVPDGEIASMLDVSPRRVASERRRRGLPPGSLDDSGRPIDWSRWRLGEIPDAALASVLGVATRVVTRARLQRGIASAQERGREH